MDPDSFWSFYPDRLVMYVTFIDPKDCCMTGFTPSAVFGVVNDIDYDAQIITILTNEYKFNKDMDSKLMMDENKIICKRYIDITKRFLIIIDDDIELDPYKLTKKAYGRRASRYETLDVLYKLYPFSTEYDEAKCDEIINLNNIYNVRSMIYRISGDFAVYCGNLRNVQLCFPIYCCDELKVKYKITNLMDIDPNMFMMKLDKNLFIAKLKQYANIWYEDIDDKEFYHRGNYQWISTIFYEDDASNKISILSPIHNLQPKQLYHATYKDIESIFSAMMPIFNQFDTFKKRKNKEFKVIVECKMNIENVDELYGKKYYHTVGLTEHILLCGMYILDGNGDFFIKFMGTDHYTVGAEYFHGEEYMEYQLIKNRAFVFENFKCIHKFKQKKDIKSKLSFIAFYLIHPTKQKQLKSTKYIPCLNKDLYLVILRDICNVECICNIIIEYTFEPKSIITKQEALLIRNDIIDEDVKYKPKWGFTYGYNGEGGWNSFFPFPHYLPWLPFDVYVECISDKPNKSTNARRKLNNNDKYWKYIAIVEPSDDELHYVKIVEQHLLQQRENK